MPRMFIYISENQLWDHFSRAVPGGLWYNSTTSQLFDRPFGSAIVHIYASAYVDIGSHILGAPVSS